MSESQIDRSRIDLPQIAVDSEALEQLKMMWQFDPTLEGKVFRFAIDGKGCDGFDYACGFDDARADDFLIEIEKLEQHHFAFDAFAARYMPFVQLSFHRDLKSGDEGFVVNNLAQDQFKGKFWRKDPTKSVPLKE